MKIALITDGIYPYVLGGMQKHSYYLAKYFSRLGHQTTVFHCTNNANPNYSEHFEANELENLNFVEVEFPKSDGLPGHYIRSSRAYSKKLFKAFWTQCKKADFIYTKGFTGIHFFKMKHLLNCPIGVQLHGLEMFQPEGISNSG